MSGTGVGGKAARVPVRVITERASDLARVYEINSAAFGRDAEAKLVDRLRACGEFFLALSLVAVDPDGLVVGCILLTRAFVDTEAGPFAALALAPMAVDPIVQRRGIGAELVRGAIAKAESLGEHLVIVLGHPDYYPRFGFAPASKWGIRPPFDAPDEAWMALWIGGAQPRRLNGVVRYAEPFMTMED